MGSSRSLPSRRNEAVWAQWRAHVEAQRSSGQTQKTYCSEHGLDQRYFSVWKSKLKRLAQPASKALTGKAAEPCGLQLVPLVIRNAADTERSTADALTLHVKLANGLSVSISLPGVRSLPSVLEQLACSRC